MLKPGGVVIIGDGEPQMSWLVSELKSAGLELVFVWRDTYFDLDKDEHVRVDYKVAKGISEELGFNPESLSIILA